MANYHNFSHKLIILFRSTIHTDSLSNQIKSNQIISLFARIHSMHWFYINHFHSCRHPLILGFTICGILRQISCFQECDIQACLCKLQDNCRQSSFVLNTCVQLINLILLMQDTLFFRVWRHLSVRFENKQKEYLKKMKHNVNN